MIQLDRQGQTVNKDALIDTRWFQDRLADKRMSQRKLASVMNLDPAAVSLMFRGRRKMSAAEAAEVARILNVEVDEVLRRAGIYAAADSARAEAAMAQHDIYMARKAFEPPRTPQQQADDARQAVERRKEEARARLAHAQHEVQRLGIAEPPATTTIPEGMIELPVPMSDGSVAKLLLPRTMTKGDADRIAAVVQALAIP